MRKSDQGRSDEERVSGETVRESEDVKEFNEYPQPEGAEKVRVLLTSGVDAHEIVERKRPKLCSRLGDECLNRAEEERRRH